MDEKLTRHQKAEQFRREIAVTTRRISVIEELVNKQSYDEADKMHIRELFRKTDHAMGCEAEYRKLIAHLYQFPELQPKAREFYKRWTAK